MKYLSQLLAALLLCSLIACNGKNERKELNKDLTLAKASAVKKDEPYKLEQDEIAGNADTVKTSRNSRQLQSTVATKSQTKEDWDKKIIKTGNLTLEVKNYANYNELLHKGIKQLGGYIAQEEQNQSDYKIENIVTVKVPVDMFDNAVSQFTPGTEKIVAEKVTSEDVTGEIVDTKSRVEAKKRVRDRYLDLLKQAKNMDEILQVQNEINDIQENIEAASGRIDYLGHAAAFSTINITFYQVLNATGVNDPNPSYSVRIAESFKSGLHWFAELFVVLVSLWPLWTGIFLAWIFIRKRISVAKKHKPVT